MAALVRVQCPGTAQTRHRCGPACPCSGKAMFRTPQRLTRLAVRAQSKAATASKPLINMGHATRYSEGYAVKSVGEPLTRWGYEMPEIGAEEVDIQPTHNGVCHSDLHMQKNDWGISTFPFIPGHEAVGLVSAIGSSVKGLAIGQRVGVGWMRNSCRRCAACLRGQENLCYKGYTGTIVGNNGGFQSVLRVPADFAFPIPDGLESQFAAPLLCAGITVFAPLKRHMLPGMNVGVIGVGGLGHLAVQFANVMGGVVTGIDVFADKEKEATKLGAKDFVHWTDTAGEKNKARFDLIINTASGAIPAKALMDMLVNDGTVVQIGIPPGNAALNVGISDLVFGQKKIAGSIVGGISDTMAMLQVAADKGVRPMIEMFPAEKVNEALAHMASGKARYRIVLDMSAAKLATTAPK